MLTDHGKWLVVFSCGAQRRWSTARWRSSRDVPCRWTWSGEGRTWGLDWRTRRLGDQPQWLTSGTSTSANVYGSDCVDQVKTANTSRASLRRTWRAGRSRTAVTHVKWRESVWSTLLVAGFAGLGLKTWTEVPMQTDATWRHRWDRFGARLPVRRCGGRQIKRKSWTRMFWG